MAESPSQNEEESGGVSRHHVHAYFAMVADLPALSSMLRFMTSDLFDCVRTELLSLGHDAGVLSYADMKLDPLEDAFDKFCEEISGEIVAIRWIRALRDLAAAREKGDVDLVKQLEAKVDEFRAAGAWFLPPEHLRSELISFGEDCGQQLE